LRAQNARTAIRALQTFETALPLLEDAEDDEDRDEDLVAEKGPGIPGRERSGKAL